MVRSRLATGVVTMGVYRLDKHAVSLALVRSAQHGRDDLYGRLMRAWNGRTQRRHVDVELTEDDLAFVAEAGSGGAPGADPARIDPTSAT